MQGLIALLLLILAALPIAVVILLVALYRRVVGAERDRSALRRELERHETRLESLQRRLVGLERDATAGAPAFGADPGATTEPDLPPPTAPTPPYRGTEVAVPIRPAAAPHTAAMGAPTPVTRPTARTRDGIEQTLSTRIPVWIGAIALALAGAFLVKYTFDRGLIGPATRVALGIAFGLTLVGAGEWLRRRAATIAHGLSAAGIAVLFAALLAGVNLYGLIPPALGFVLMALTTGAAVVLSLRHGPVVALLGLLGGFMTPFWIGVDDPDPWRLFGYLLLLQVGLLAVARRRGWWPVAGLTLAGGLGWALLVLTGFDPRSFSGAAVPLGLFLLCSALTQVAFLALSPAAGPGRRGVTPVAMVGLALTVLALGGLVGASEFDTIQWAFFALLGTGCLVLGRREPRFEALAWIAAAVTGVLLWVQGSLPFTAEYDRFLATLLAFGVLWTVGPWLALWGSPRPARWAAMGAGAAVTAFLVGVACVSDLGQPLPWGLLALLVAACLALLALPIYRQRAALPGGERALAAMAVGVTALCSLAAPIELERAWIGVAWAVEVPVLLWIGRRLRVPALDHAVRVLGGLVAVRLLLNPALASYPTGRAFALNWLTYGYGVPTVAFGITAWSFERLERRRDAYAFSYGALTFVFAWITLGVRQAFHPGELFGPRAGTIEAGVVTVAWLVFAAVLLESFRRTDWAPLRHVALLVAALAGVQGLLMQGLVLNPLFVADPVGALPLLNGLLVLYAVPAALLGWLAWRLGEERLRLPAPCAGTAALVFLLLAVTLNVRQLFHGSVLARGDVGLAESYTYSTAWIVLGTLLLLAGIATRGRVLRYGSAVVMLLAVGKVFLIDTAHLRDLYRVLSLFGLGVSLMLLAWLYQRYVFVKPRDQA